MAEHPEPSGAESPRRVRVRACPACGSVDVVPIEYGLVTEADFAADRVPGGCVVFEDSPNLACRSCDHRWVRDKRR